MDIYIVCLLCLLVNGALGAFMGYKAGFAAGKLSSLEKSAAKGEEGECKRGIRGIY